jgi:hypothetical protein
VYGQKCKCTKKKWTELFLKKEWENPQTPPDLSKQYLDYLPGVIAVIIKIIIHGEPHPVHKYGALN